MATWKEAREAKVRQRREHRFYTPDLLGKPCNYCKAKVPKALNDVGIYAHPSCGPSEMTVRPGATA